MKHNLTDFIFSSLSASAASSTFSSISSSIASAHATNSPVTSSAAEASITTSEAPVHTPESEKEIREKAQIVVSNDLKTWQEKFAKAADEGSDDLEERITEITERLVKNQAQGVGNALIVQLEETVKSSLQDLKSSIISIVKTSGAQDSEASEEALNTAVRKAGIAIKEKTQAVRTWRQSYDRETNSLVSKTAQDTLDILDLIRDSGLQEIGMRWAWTDGITHKDWAKYHKLKTKFDEWRYDVEKVAIEHPGLIKARASSEEVENQAMGIAEEAATELARLKETGRWKISAGDSSDDFSTKHMPAAAVVAGQKVIEKISEISEAIVPTSQGTLESVVSVASSSEAEGVSSVSSLATSQVENIQSAASSVSASVVGTPQGSVEIGISVASASASSVADQASSSIIGTQQGSVESVLSHVKATVSSVIDRASSSVVGTSQGIVESVASVALVAGESLSSLSAEASSSIVGKEPGIAEKASDNIKSATSVVSESISSGGSQVSDGASKASEWFSSATSSIASSLSKSASDTSSSISSEASSASSTASKKVWGGAMAQHVEARHIIFDDIVDDSDDETFSEKLQSLASQAGDRYSDITKAVSEALLKPTSSEEFPMTKLAAEKYSSALSAASVALYGSEQGTGESVSSVISSRYADAVAA